MERPLAALSLALLVGALIARPVAGAAEITVSLSPAEGVVGRPTEVLVRTYAPVGGEGVALPVPSLAYPAPSGLWNVLYPIADYPFDVEARSPTGEAMQVRLTRDAADGSLWRGTFTPNAAGEWSIVVGNFPSSEPTRLVVRAGETLPGSAIVGVAGLLVGLIAGLVAGPTLRRRFAPA